ncbi:MAG: response regulator [Bdellovibrionaceae bacterium]|nr:response regulator [Pseudobdellovibrionaceae bacterium]
MAYRKKQYDVRDLLAELDSARHEAVEANRAKSDFLANMSHEMRTPLGAILGFSELMMDGGVSEREKQAYMTTVKRNGQLLSALIDDVLDLAKVESGRVEIAAIEFSLNELLSEIVSLFEPEASRKDLPLRVQRPAKDDELVLGDPLRLKQILVNIVGNALKFTSHGFISVKVSVVSEPLARIDIEVEDTGIGISPQQAARLFLPFTQVDTSTTRRYGGTGLGLVLSQKLVRAMGGDLKLNWSLPGGGSNFGISLPTQVIPQPASLAGSVSNNMMPLSEVRILVVDDSLDNQILISRILKLLGADVDLASDGVDGVERAMAAEYDVVLMDLQMPRMGGVEATRLLRKRGYRRPIIALTAHSLNEDRERCISVGCTEYLTKPIQRNHLVQVIERLSREASSGLVGLH